MGSSFLPAPPLRLDERLGLEHDVQLGLIGSRQESKRDAFAAN